MVYYNVIDYKKLNDILFTEGGKLSMVRSFLPVGQGAFYCECFANARNGHNLNIVYDCGSLSHIGYVKQAIKNNFKKGEKIDAVFISHLDDDHINGIPFLLEYCEVKRIYFPIIASKNREIMRIYYYANNVNGFTYDFFYNPDHAIESLNIDYKPELIQIEEIGQDYNDLDINSRRSGDNVYGDIKNDTGINVTMYSEWLYIPFNFRQHERIDKLMDNLAIQFGKVITEYDLREIWRNNIPGDRDKIKEAYKKVPGTLNTNSMTLFSGEINYDLRQFIGASCFNYCRRFFGCHYKPSGCLYTGDYDAAGKRKWAQLKKAYENYWDYIGCVQIPHHGSLHNFNDDFLDMNAFFVISCGFSNRNRHPHASVIKSFLLRCIMPYIVTEQIGSAAYFLIKE